MCDAKGETGTKPQNEESARTENELDTTALSKGDEQTTADERTRQVYHTGLLLRARLYHTTKPRNRFRQLVAPRAHVGKISGLRGFTVSVYS